MSPSRPDTLRRLRAANPVPVQTERAQSAKARATLERILTTSAASPPRRRFRLRVPRSGAGVAAAVLLAGTGAALAATNPFGWWSANPDTARYAVNPALHARTPSATQIRCHTGSTHLLSCAASGSGQLYTKADTIRPLPSTQLSTRSNLTKAIARSEAGHRISRDQAAQFRHDLRHVSDSFFVTLRLAFRYGTYGGANSRVPPPRVPEFLVCEQARLLTCQNLNGDSRTPVGAGVYMAEPAPDWRPAPARRREPFLPPGVHFTRAESRVLIDLMKTSTTTSSSSGPRSVPARPAR